MSKRPIVINKYITNYYETYNDHSTTNNRVDNRVTNNHNTTYVVRTNDDKPPRQYVDEKSGLPKSADSDTGSDVSTAELDVLGAGEDWLQRAFRSVSNTPVEGDRVDELRRVSRMGSVPENENVPYQGRDQWIVRSSRVSRPRAERSPPPPSPALLVEGRT